MRRDTVARIELLHARKPSPRFFAQAKLPTDGPDHPYGQWSLAVELLGPPDEEGIYVAWVAFASDLAPRHALEHGAELELYLGAERVGMAVVVAAPRRDAPRSSAVDADILTSIAEPPRKAA